MESDLIAALATPAAAGSIGIIRLSGAGIDRISSQLLDRPAVAGRICKRSFLADDRAVIDEGIALLFAAPGSFTGEDVLELQGHGGVAVLDLLLQRCLQLGARQAAPGEFTRRAFANGRISLEQAEGIADLIGATTDRAARLAAASARGAIGDRCRGLSGRLRKLRADIEALIDFSDQDIEPESGARLRAGIGRLAGELAGFTDECRASLALRRSARITLIGAPNVGKSSILNRLAGEQAAIVADEPGTTRDLVRAAVCVNGLAVEVTDTAGLRGGGSRTEREGMRRALASARESDMTIEVRDCRQPDAPAARPEGLPEPDLIALNKIDAGRIDPGADGRRIRISAKTGAGFRLLAERIGRHLAGDGGETTLLARQRHVDALQRAQAELAAAASHDPGAAPELAAELLRRADACLGEIVGAAVADDILGDIFSRFCIGK